MKEQFIPYEQALQLKELGFGDNCLAWYNIDTLCLFGEDMIDRYAGEPDRPEAPLWQQAFDWFESKFGLSGEIQKQAPYQNVTKPYWWYMIQDEKGKDISDWQGRFNKILVKSHQDVDGNYVDDDKFIKYLSEDGFAFINRMEARLACLKKLIELCKKH